MKWTILIVMMLITACAPYTRGPKININERPHTAVMLIDFQRDFFGDDAPMPVDPTQGQTARRTAGKLVAYAEINNLPLIVISNAFSKDDRIANFFRRGAAVEGSPGAALIDELSDADAVHFTKGETDAFSNGELNAFLAEHRIGSLIVAGVFADNCVLGTTKGARFRGFNVTIVKDGIATASNRRLKVALKAYRKNGVSIKAFASL